MARETKGVHNFCDRRKTNRDGNEISHQRVISVPLADHVSLNLKVDVSGTRAVENSAQRGFVSRMESVGVGPTMFQCVYLKKKGHPRVQMVMKQIQAVIECKAPMGSYLCAEKNVDAL